MSREIVSIFLGQAGCQIGQQVWELLATEHGIRPNGVLSEDAPADRGMLETFFDLKGQKGNAFKPRAVLIDTDPAYVLQIQRSAWRHFFTDDSLLAYKHDCRSNYQEGRLQARKYHILEELTNAIRKKVEACSNVQGFFAFHSVGGGTGSGVTAELFDQLEVDFPKKHICDFAIMPSKDHSNCIVEPYNSVLYVAATKETASLTLCIDNQAAYSICHRNLRCGKPDFSHLNSIIAQMVSAMSTSFRYKSEMSASIDELVTNLIPSKPFRYGLLALSPLCHPQSERAKKGFTLGGEGDILRDCFESKNVLCDTGHSLKLNRFLACALLMRGHEPDGRAIKYRDAMSGLEDLVKWKSATFLPWMSDGAWKLGVVGVSPTESKRLASYMAKSKMQATLIANTTAIRSVFLKQNKCKDYHQNRGRRRCGREWSLRAI
eukprot:GEMP01009008.1.p1 GENE.GEMP01009008.1~~GEMP01009008.1.p1  ORF type:complete len:433 (+),score=80.63 GEMP01009008.1:168-1466(+)